MNWTTSIKGFIVYLQLEKSLSQNSIAAYQNDLLKLQQYAENAAPPKVPTEMGSEDLSEFVNTLADLQLVERSQARMISAIRGFYKYLCLEGMLEKNPAKLLDAPKLPKKIPTYLTIEEVDQILNRVDMSSNSGHRDRAIVEVLYACGLRVSELINLKISNLDFEVEVISVLGKGNRERLVPINQSAIHYTSLYLEHFRSKQNVVAGCEDFVFLNARGKNISRISIFNIVKDLVREAEIKKNVSPHTFRHSFATHLYQAGADLRAIQDMLGHRSILTTEIYSHVNPSHLKKTMESFHPRFIVEDE